MMLAPVLALEAPAVSAPAAFQLVPFVVSAIPEDTTRSITIGYRVFFDQLQMNANDEIRQVTALANVSPGRLRGTLYFVAPYEPGGYDVELYAMQASGWVPLRREADGPASFRITVLDRVKRQGQ